MNIVLLLFVFFRAFMDKTNTKFGYHKTEKGDTFGLLKCFYKTWKV